VFARTGTTSLGQAAGIVLIPDDIEELRVEFELGGGTGEFRVHEIQTKMVTLLPYIPKLIIVLPLGWGLLALVVLWAVIRAGFWLLVSGAALMIFHFTNDSKVSKGIAAALVSRTMANHLGV
jgi:hypothetical protein